MSNKDIIIGHVTKYTFEHIKPWIISLDRCGFDGEKVLCVYDMDISETDKIKEYGVSICYFNVDEDKGKFFYIDGGYNVVVERFSTMVDFFTIRDYRYVITTDVKDVIFQSNPIDWIEKNIGDKKILVSTESIKYRHEHWGLNNMLQSFAPKTADYMKDQVIYNCGVLAGRVDYMKDLFRNIYMICDGHPAFIPGGGGPDQAALNVILSMNPFKDCTKFAMSEEGWAAQLGTTGPQVKDKFGDVLIEESPIFVNGKVCTSKGDPFVIVHQYDRVPEWRDKILDIYA